MIGKWIITYKGTAVDGGSMGFYECSNCHKKCCATEMPQYFFDKDGKWHDPNFCPNCGSDNRKREDNRWNNAEVIITNLQELLSNYENYKDEEDCYWWFNEYDSDLTWMIDCHPVFSDSTPCLNKERGDPEYGSCEYEENCKECKARWLLEVFE